MGQIYENIKSRGLYEDQTILEFFQDISHMETKWI